MAKPFNQVEQHADILSRARSLEIFFDQQSPIRVERRFAIKVQGFGNYQLHDEFKFADGWYRVTHICSAGFGCKPFETVLFTGFDKFEGWPGTPE